MGIAAIALAQYPSKPVRLVVPFAAGGSGDFVARLITGKLAEQTGRAFVVENRIGAGGRIGYESAAKAPNDGYTLAATDATYTMLPGLYPVLGWDQANDLVPVTITADSPFVLVASASGKFKTLGELIKYAKAQPGKVTFGSAGVGSVNHIVTEMFKREAGLELLHVPYKGTSDAVTGMLTGSVDFVITALPTAIPQIRGGKAVGLAVTASKRSAALPDVPTVAEVGFPTFIAGNWFGVTAPKGTSPAIIQYLHREVAKALEAPDVKERLASQGLEPSGMAPEAFGKLLADDTRRWTDLIRGASIKAE